MKNYELFVGVDISKKTFDASLTRTGDLSQMLHAKFDNTTAGFKKLSTWVKKYKKKNSITGPVLFGMEHTGIYTLALCVFMKEQQLDYTIESGLQIKRSLGIRRGKDDKSDSKDIAKYVLLHVKSLKINNLLSARLMRLKNLLAFRAKLVKQKVMLEVSAKEADQLLPEEFKVDLIQEKSTDFINAIKAAIRQVEKAILAIIKENKELDRLYQLVSSVKGIGLIIGANMLVHTQAFKAFQNARQFACYIAVAPFGQQSGSSLKIDPKVSKLGYTKLKALFSNACCSAIQHDQQIKAYFKRKIAEGKKEGCVYNAIKNKLIARIFAVVKRGTPFVDLKY